MYKSHMAVATALVLMQLALPGEAQKGRFPATTPTGTSQETHEILYEKDVEALIESDRTLPPPANGIEFIGSSIFREWTNVEQQMDPLPAFNKAFGGSRTWEVLHYMDRLVLPYRPWIVVYYCGSNDINAGEPPDAIATRFKRFAERLHESLPETRLYYVSIIKAPQKMSHWDDVDKANAQIKAYCESSRWMGFINVNPIFFKKLGQPRMEVYRDDGLHLVPSTYSEMAAIVKPVIEKAYHAMQKQGKRKAR